MEAFQNAALSPGERAQDLLKRMTIREKVGQLNQRLYGFKIYERCGENFTLTQEFKDEVERFGGLGTLYGLYRADPWADKDEQTGIVLQLSSKAYNQVQEYVISHSRLGIPMLLSTECPHGHQALGGGLLPVNLAAGATFDPDLLKSGYEACGRQLASGHVDLALMSVLDILRDPRWGRSEECYSEDPFLSAQMAAAAVTGMQSSGVSCVAKHFCGQGETTGGVNASAARIGERELREIHFPAAQACCRAGVDGIMAAYNEIDGIYCHSNAWLLRQVLREEMGFHGVVMADGLAIDFLKTAVGDTLHAAKVALEAGVDISLWDEAFSRLDEAIEQGLVEERLLDEAVLRVLELKFRRGLFEHPYMEENMMTSQAAGVDQVSLELARESAVLLKNKKTTGNSTVLKSSQKKGKEQGRECLLPLGNRFSRIGVVGYHAADRYCQLGDYTPSVSPECCVTVLEGLRSTAPLGVEIDYCMGAGFRERIPQELEQAIELAERSDVIVAVVGGSSSRFGGAVFDDNGAVAGTSSSSTMDCGEGMDCASLHIPAAQEELLKTLRATGKPIVTVVIGGRPYCISDIVDCSDALLYAFYPGPMGGQAIAEILYGNCEPSGRLPVSVPRHAGQIPVYYNSKASSQARYYDLEEGPLYTFGDGLTYTEFELESAMVFDQQTSHVQPSESEQPLQEKEMSFAQQHTEENCLVSVSQLDNGTLKVCFRLQNIGKRPGTAIPQLYLRRLSGSTVPRVWELKGFQRFSLKPGESKEVNFLVDKEQLTTIGLSGQPEEITGTVRLLLKDSGKEYWSGEYLIK